VEMVPTEPPPPPPPPQPVTEVAILVRSTAIHSMFRNRHAKTRKAVSPFPAVAFEVGKRLAGKDKVVNRHLVYV